jgi:UDP-N-acetylglucosamine 4-epimerase
MQLTSTQLEKISTSTFLVTGGAGFIGSHIAEWLLNAGAGKVRVLDNMATGNFRNIAPFANHRRFQFENGDIRFPEVCKVACKDVDYVFHQAASDSGFLNMLAAAHDGGVKRFVYASGSSIYAYDKAVNITNDIETIGLRYFNVFGARQNTKSEYASVIPKYAMQLIRHESPLVIGTGEYCRNFTYIEDVVQANILAALTTDSQAINQVYDIAFEERISLYQLALCLKEFCSAFDKTIAGIKIVHGPAPGKITTATPFIEKAKKLLGYKPCYSLRNGLLKSAGWYWAYLQQSYTTVST